MWELSPVIVGYGTVAALMLAITLGCDHDMQSLICRWFHGVNAMQLSKFEDFVFEVLAKSTVVLCGGVVLMIAAIQLPFYVLLRRN